MTLEELRNKKREFGYSNQQISDLSGVPMGTVQKIFSGKTAAPRYATLKALEAVFVTEKPDQNSGRERLSPEPMSTSGTYYPKDHSGAGLQKFSEQKAVYGRAWPSADNDVHAGELELFCDRAPWNGCRW